MRERMRKCIALLPRVLSEDDPDAVHDLRVCSRRLQQVRVTLFPNPLPPEARALVKTLRRTRRSLGEWRDSDVAIAMLRRKLRGLRSPAQKEAWMMVLESARAALEKHASRARRKIANRKMFTLAHRGHQLIRQRAHADAPRDSDPFAVLGESVGVAYQDWRKSLAKAASSVDPADIHAFRIQTKRLRYRIELMRDLGSETARTALGSLKTLQDELGRWHDSLAFTRITAEAIANPDFLVQHPTTAAAMLRRLDRDNARNLERVRKLLAAMQAEADASAFHAAIAELAGTPPRHSAESAASEEPSPPPETASA